MRVVNTCEILRKLRTTGDVDVCLIRGCHVLKQLVHPIHVWITLKLFEVGRVAVLVQAVLCEIVGPSLRTIRKLRLDNLVAQAECIVGIHHVRKL